MLFKIENPLHMQLVISLSFVKLLWPFVRYMSYSHDQDHVHSTYILPTSTLEVVREHFTHPSIIIPVNKTPFYSWLLFPSYHFKMKDMGYAKRNKCHAQESMIKKERELDTWRSKYSKVRERKIARVQRKKERKRERDSSWKESTHHPYKNIHTHAHLDQGLWLVSPSDPVFDLATYEEQVCLQFSPYPELHIKAFLEVGEKDDNNLPWWGNQKKAKREIWENKLRS